MPNKNDEFLEELEIETRGLIVKLIDETERQLGFSLRIVSGRRDSKIQAALYAEGRDGDGNIVDRSKVVTFAKPGRTFHEKCRAGDLLPEVKGKVLNDERGNYNKLLSVGIIAETLGFTWGHRFKNIDDNDHFENSHCLKHGTHHTVDAFDGIGACILT